MDSKPKLAPPPLAALTRIAHVVAFYETDAMGVVHHSNYFRFLEHARVQFLADHDRPYVEYVKEGFHVPVTRASVSYKRPCRFADTVEVSCWLAWARQASFGFAYRLELKGQLVALAETDHAIIDLEGRPTRIPEAMRARMAHWFGARADARVEAHVPARERKEEQP
jgi:acyl-CoA thioester hydrolase